MPILHPLANFFLEKGDQDKIPIDNLKLQKLVYIAYGWSLAVLNARLFNEPIQAWRHGPVIPSLFHEFKHCGNRPITERALDISWDDDEGLLEEARPDVGSPDLDIVLTKVWEVYKDFTGWELRDKTHQHDTPWWGVYEENQNKALGDAEIERHFVEKLRDILDEAKKARVRQSARTRERASGLMISKLSSPKILGAWRDGKTTKRASRKGMLRVRPI